MGHYNFDEIIDRKGTYSIKWDHLEDRFGNENLLPLWVADMDFRSPPEILNAMKAVVEQGILGYVLPKSDYFSAVEGWMKRRFDWQIDPDWISFTPGIVPAIALAVNAFTEPGDGIIVQQPVYHPFMGVTEDSGRKVVNNRLLEENGKYFMDFEDLEKKAQAPNTKAMILCSPHNPIGRVWTQEELQRVVDICKKNNVILISDEIHQDLVYEGHVHIPTAKLADPSAKIMTCTAPSKTFNIAGVFASNIIISNETLREQYRAELEKAHLMPSPFAISGVMSAYNEGAPWLEELMHYLSDNVDFVESYLKNNLPKVGFVKPEATFLLWLDFRAYGFGSSKLEEIITQDAQLALNNGWMFGEEGAEHMRLNIGCPRDVLKEALDRLTEAVGKHI